MYPYRYVKTFLSGCFGSGALGTAFCKPQTNPLNDGFNRPGFAVRGTLAPTSVAFIKDTQQVPFVALTGNGLDLQGQFSLQALSKLSNPNG